MPFTSEQLETLRSQLPKGAAGELAEKFNYKAGSIRNILSGLSNNDEVVIAAYEMAKTHQQKLATAKAALSA